MNQRVSLPAAATDPIGTPSRATDRPRRRGADDRSFDDALAAAMSTPPAAHRDVAQIDDEPETTSGARSDALAPGYVAAAPPTSAGAPAPTEAEAAVGGRLDVVPGSDAADNASGALELAAATGPDAATMIAGPSATVPAAPSEDLITVGRTPIDAASPIVELGDDGVPAGLDAFATGHPRTGAATSPSMPLSDPAGAQGGTGDTHSGGQPTAGPEASNATIEPGGTVEPGGSTPAESGEPLEPDESKSAESPAATTADTGTVGDVRGHSATSTPQVDAPHPAPSHLSTREPRLDVGRATEASSTADPQAAGVDHDRPVPLRPPASHRLALDLSSEGLGPLRVEALAERGTLHLNLTAGDKATRDALGAHLPELRRDLESSGLQLGTLDVGDGREHRRDQSAEPAPTGSADHARPARRDGGPATGTGTVLTARRPSGAGFDLRL